MNHIFESLNFKNQKGVKIEMRCVIKLIQPYEVQ
jgi:hypothetical protein